MLERRESSPMDHVLMFRRAPVLRQEAIPTPDDFGVEIGRQFRPIVSQASNPEVSTQEGGGEIHILEVSSDM